MIVSRLGHLAQLALKEVGSPRPRAHQFLLELTHPRVFRGQAPFSRRAVGVESHAPFVAPCQSLELDDEGIPGARERVRQACRLRVYPAELSRQNLLLAMKSLDDPLVPTHHRLEPCRVDGALA